MVSGFGWTHEKLAPTGVVAVGRWDHVWMTKTTCQHLIWSQVLHSFPNFYPRYRCPWGTGRLDDWGVNPGVGDILIFAGWHPLDCWTIYPCFVAWIPSNPREVSKIPEILANAPDFAAAVAEPSPPVSSSWPGVYQQKWEKCNVNPEVINVNFRNKLAGLYLRSVLRNNCMQYAKYIKSNVVGSLAEQRLTQCYATNFETGPPFFHVDLFNLISTFGFLQTEALPAAKKGRPQAPLLSIWIINLTAN